MFEFESVAIDRRPVNVSLCERISSQNGGIVASASNSLHLCFILR